jgi:hypothetical protein
MLPEYATLEIVWVTCGANGCSLPVGMPKKFYEAKKKSRSTWYCPAGHCRIFVGETNEERLKRELEYEKQHRQRAEQDKERARHAAAIARGKLNAAKERVGNGVCPCCKRSFENLRRHMATKHPSYKKPELVVIEGGR